MKKKEGWSIIVEKSEKEGLQKLREQLDEGQKVAGHVEEMLAEARSFMQAYTRNSVNIRYENLNDVLLEAAKSSEILTEKMRRLALEMTCDKKKYENYQKDIVLIHGIVVDYTDDILSVSLPALIPHRKSDYTNFIYKPLYTAFQHWCIKQAESNMKIPEYKKCTVCFFHFYNENLPLYRIRDHDNIEEKHVLDVITNFFMTSDSGRYANIYHETCFDVIDRTVIYLVPSEKFPLWLYENQKK